MDSAADKLLPLPETRSEKLARSFTLENSPDITSLAVAPHGAFILAGCGNGIILMFDLASPSRTGTVVGYIQAKGLHTNLLVTVKFSDDGRFGFAGVTKGSMELLALDFSAISVWPTKDKRRRHTLDALTVPFTHSDPKLRGFGAVARIPTPGGATRGAGPAEYRLACGRGIKNVHIWQFLPDVEGGAVWNCIFDVASNGNTIETVSFRKDGHEVVSKSASVVLRIWDLAKAQEEAAADSKGTPEEDSGATDAAVATTTAVPAPSIETGKVVPFQDVPNSQDSKAMAGNFAFGGDYAFAVVKIDAPKAANRDAIGIPSKADDSAASSNRRRRTMRQIASVCATDDGLHVLVRCSDGGALYFQNLAAGDGSAGAGHSMVEMSHLEYDPELDGAWIIQRVGREGAVLLARAVCRDGEYRIVTSLLVNEVATAGLTVKETALSEKLGADWHKWGYFWDESKSVALTAKLDEKADASLEVLEDVVPPLPGITGSAEKAASSNARRRESGHAYKTPGKDKESRKVQSTSRPTRHSSGSGSSSGSMSSSSSSNGSEFRTPAAVLRGKRGRDEDISPADAVAMARDAYSKTPSAAAFSKRVGTYEEENRARRQRLAYTDLVFVDEPRPHMKLSINPAPRIQRVRESVEELTEEKIGVGLPATLKMTAGLAEARKVCAKWRQEHRTAMNDALRNASVTTSATARKYLFEECRMRLLFAGRIERCLCDVDATVAFNDLEKVLASLSSEHSAMKAMHAMEWQCWGAGHHEEDSALPVLQDMIVSARALEARVKDLIASQ